MDSHSIITQDGDFIQLVGISNAYHFVRLKKGEVIQTHRGVIQRDDLIGKSWGSQISSHLGRPFFLLKPSIAEIICNTKRNTQILYPKDIGFILLSMDIGPGCIVIEAGTGSGGLTQALAFAVGQTGRVYSYEIREEMIKLAQKNLMNLGLIERVTIYHHNIQKCFFEKNVDAIFLDLPNPYDYINQVYLSLIPGGHFGTILPTTNQVVNTLIELKRNLFSASDVCEILLRYYKVEFDRFRPTDRMVSHTGYLIFSRKIIDHSDQMVGYKNKEE